MSITQFNRLCLLLIAITITCGDAMAERQRIKAIGIPLADHYAGIVAYEKYRNQMQFADYQIKILPGPGLVRAYFRSEADADIAFNVSPMVMDMFAKKPDFRWVSLIHRDGNALAINELMNEVVNLNFDQKERLPNNQVANAISLIRQKSNRPIEIAIPHLMATHTTILYKYLRDNGVSIGFRPHENKDVVLKVVKPPESPVYLQKQASHFRHAAFEQSLPWAEVVETDGYGYVAWYSKDVMKHQHGHVECIIIAKDEVIANKAEALREVIHYIHRAGRDIELARRHGGDAMEEIVDMVRRHIPAHTRRAIIESLRIDLNVINYMNLNVDANAKESFRDIMELALEAGFIKEKIDINKLADDQFSSDITFLKFGEESSVLKKESADGHF